MDLDCQVITLDSHSVVFVFSDRVSSRSRGDRKHRLPWGVLVGALVLLCGDSSSYVDDDGEMEHAQGKPRVQRRKTRGRPCC